MQWRIPPNPIAEFLVEPDTRDADYSLLLSVLASQCPRFSLIWRNDFRGYGSPSQRSVELAKQLSPYLIEEERVVEWPATTIVSPIPQDGRPILRWYASDAAAIEILQRTRPSLIHWMAPAFPEDPCFYLDSGDCCLVTTSHEGGAVVFVPTEVETLLQMLDPLIAKGLLRPISDCNPI